MMNTLMVYGAAGYTGRMVVAQAKALGLETILAGRDEKILARLALESGLPYRVFPLDDSAAVAAGLAGVNVLINCAGPFMRTAEPLMQNSILSGGQYLDIAAEMDSYHLAESLDEEAVLAGVMLMPGGGGSVAMLGCLAEHAMKRVARPDKVSIALHVSGGMSRGSATTTAQNVSRVCLARVGGVLVPRNPQEIRQFDFGKGMVDCFPVTLPDLVTIWRASGTPNIETFVHVSGAVFPAGDHSAMPEGPSAEQRAANRYQASVVVTGDGGKSVRSLLDTVNGYSFTPMAAAEAARRVLLGDVRPGFQVPAKHFGAGFAETIADTRIMDVQT